MMSLEFSGPDSPFSGPVAQISCGRYVPAHWQEAITYRPLAALQVSCQHGIAFIDLPSTWSGSTRPAGIRSRWIATVPWASTF